MPWYDPKRVYDADSYGEAIVNARKDLERDHPNCYVFIHSRESGRVDVIRKDPPFGLPDIVTGCFEIKSHALFSSTFGYDFYVLAEGLLSYSGSTESRYWTVSDGTVIEKHATILPGTYDPTGNVPPSGNDVLNRFRQTSFVDPANWMGDSRINGKSLISAFTLVGTHNSHATGPNICFPANVPIAKGWAQCQTWGVLKQLELGVRFVDLRVGSGMKMVHAAADLDGTLWTVLDDITRFLLQHRTEAVIVSIKWDEEKINGSVVPEPPSFGPDMDKMTRERGSWYTGSIFPSLDEVRGKMILLCRFGNSTLGLDLNQFKGGDKSTAPPGLDPRESLWIENKSALEWIRTASTTKDVMWMTWFSGYDSGKNLNPRDFAHYVNPKLQRYLDETSVPRVERLGLVCLDFLDNLYTTEHRERDSASFLAERLILTNFA